MKRVLVLSVSSWNSVCGANTWESLLETYNSSYVANICIRDEIPDSKVCSRYFSISENRIIKSLFRRSIKTGIEILPENSRDGAEKDLQAHNERYKKMKNRPYPLLLAREMIWKIGKWHTPELDAFLDSFQPDIILHSMEGYIHLNRIVEYAIKRTGAKAVGYIWDDNFTYKQSKKLGYKVYRFFQRRSLRSLAKKTTAFFAITEKTKEEADAFFGIDCHVLTKPLNSIPVVEYGQMQKPIRLLYTGNLYIGRDQSLLKVVEAIKKFPIGTFFVDVYTGSQLEEAYLAKIDPKVCCIHAPIPQAQVIEKQKEADILLFLEDIDGPDAQVARLSFSTKLTDYLSSGRCIFAVGNGDTAPMRYLRDYDAAFTACAEDEIIDCLQRIAQAPEQVVACAKRAAELGIQNHSKEKIQTVFDGVINNLESTAS